MAAKHVDRNSEAYKKNGTWFGIHGNACMNMHTFMYMLSSVNYTTIDETVNVANFSTGSFVLVSRVN